VAHLPVMLSILTYNNIEIFTHCKCGSVGWCTGATCKSRGWIASSRWFRCWSESIRINDDSRHRSAVLKRYQYHSSWLRYHSQRTPVW